MSGRDQLADGSIGLVVGLRVTSEVLEGGALRGGEERVVVRMKGRSPREVVLMVVVVLFLGVMIGGCLLHLEEEVWREEWRG
jgi:di/tricarboxylate transporter